MLPPGLYYDKKHGGCLRLIQKPRKQNSKTFTQIIVGAYGDNESEAPGKKWTASAISISPNESWVVFDGKKTHHGSYNAKYSPRTRKLHWPDGNYWIRMYNWLE
jgi:hypothetical protein